MKQIRVLTLYQPWATLLVYGIKKNETRPSTTNHTLEKGIYLIHAAKKWTKEQNDICLTEPFKSKLENLGYPVSLESHYASINGLNGVVFPLGQIIGSFEVKECLRVKELHKEKAILSNWNNVYEPELSFGNYSIGRSIWIGQNHKILKNPIPYKGGQGYYQKFKGNIEELEYL